MFVQGFSGTVYQDESISCEVDGFTATATIYRDDDADAPWKREDGHGPVEGRSGRGFHRNGNAKRGGELILSEERGGYATFYDFAAAVRLARRDGWGVPAYRLDTEHGANGLQRVTGQWFEGRELQSFRSDWCDDAGEAVRQVYAAHRATFASARAYAATAARADFDRLRAWINDEWEYVGVDVTISRKGIKQVDQYSHALWGIESDSGDYLTSVANELLGEALESAREAIAALTE